MVKKNTIIYNKLVRDKIPQIIEVDGKKYSTRVAEKEELIELLEAKLVEEANEFHEAKNLEELVDLMEVIFGLSVAIGFSENELMKLRKIKKEKRGGFEKGIVLEEVFK